MSTNPFKRIRLEEDLTIVELAKRTGITKQALIRLEQGTFPEALPTALQYFSANFHLSELELHNEYKAYQHSVRASHPRYFGDVRTKLESPLDPENITQSHPLRLLRGPVSPTVVAKDLCIPQATLVYFERNVIQQKSVPKILITVMREVGHFKSETDALIASYDLYRKALVTYRESNGLRTQYGYQPRAKR